MSARSALREMTRADHYAVDRLFSRFDLSDRASYRRFLQTVAKAHLPIERALQRAGANKVIAGWSERRRGDLLCADLRDLHAEMSSLLPSPEFRGADEVLGGVYVLEGSRLGGVVLSSALRDDAPSRFLTAPTAPGAWQSLLTLLDAQLADASRLARAANSARVCFELFELAATSEMETLVA